MNKQLDNSCMFIFYLLWAYLDTFYRKNCSNISKTKQNVVQEIVNVLLSLEFLVAQLLSLKYIKISTQI